MTDPDANDWYMTVTETANFFGVHTKTIIRWAKLGKLPYAKTPGGHHRFPLSQALRIKQENTTALREESR